MAKIKCKFSQVILYVDDMDSEVQFYRDTLGFSVRFPKGVDNYNNHMWVELDTGECILALHAGEPDKPNGKQELIFTVKDLADAHKALMDAGIEMSDIRKLEDGAFITTGLDPAGHRFSVRS